MAAARLPVTVLVLTWIQHIWCYDNAQKLKLQCLMIVSNTRTESGHFLVDIEIDVISCKINFEWKSVCCDHVPFSTQSKFFISLISKFLPAKKEKKHAHTHTHNTHTHTHTPHTHTRRAIQRISFERVIWFEISYRSLPLTGLFHVFESIIYDVLSSRVQT